MIGRSGCGKTTMLKLMNGLLMPDEGQVIVDGQNLQTTDLIALRRNIGYVIQNRGLFPHMTVEKTLCTCRLSAESETERKITILH